MNTTAKGNRAELDAWEWIESGESPLGDGWLVGTRRKGRREKGPGDHLVYKFGRTGRLVEVKETKGGPYTSFLPDERRLVLDLARRYTLQPILVWRPAPSKPFRWIPHDEWP